MEDNPNGRQPKWKQLKWMTTQLKDDPNERQPKWKTTQMKDNPNERQH